MKILLAIRLDAHKASILEFATRERADAFIRDFQAKYGRVSYVITVSRAGRRRRPSGDGVQMRLAV